MTYPQVIAFTEGDETGRRDYQAVSLYLDDVKLNRLSSAPVPDLLAEFFRNQEHPHHRGVTHFEDAGYLAAAFARWYYAMEAIEVAFRPYTSDYDWQVRCLSDGSLPVVAQADEEES